MYQFRYKYCDRDTQRCQKCAAGTQITNIKETLTKPTSHYSTVGSTGVSAKRLRKQALNLPALPHPAQSLTFARIWQRVSWARFLFFFFNGQRFCYFKNLEKLDLAPIPHVSSGRLKPREIKCTVNVPTSAGSKEENKQLVSPIPWCQRDGEAERWCPAFQEGSCSDHVQFLTSEELGVSPRFLLIS